MRIIDASEDLRKRTLIARGIRSVASVAHEIGIAHDTLSLWLSGRGGNPTLGTLTSIEAWCDQQETRAHVTTP